MSNPFDATVRTYTSGGFEYRVARVAGVPGIADRWRVSFTTGDTVVITVTYHRFDAVGAWEDDDGNLLAPGDPLIAQLEAAREQYAPLVRGGTIR
jgi:hypothetical protein